MNKYEMYANECEWISSYMNACIMNYSKWNECMMIVGNESELNKLTYA